MKQILIQVVIVFVGLTTAISQEHLLLTEDKHWIFLTHQENDFGVNILSGHLVNVQGDTLIGGEVYKKLYSYNLIGEHNCQFPPCFTPNIPYEIENKSLYALMREDTQTRIIYHYNSGIDNCEQEYELFNFLLDVRDTIHNCVRDRITFEDDDGIIDSISTIEIFNDQRIVLFTKGDAVFEGLQFSDQLKIIEGIGFERYGFFGGTQDELIDVCFGSFNECNITTSTQNFAPKQNIKIYPNPARDQLNIVSEERIRTVSIIDINGKTIYRGGNKIINIEFLNSGIYYLSLVFQSEECLTTKFVKIY